MRIFLAIIMLILATGAASAERIWINNITVGEYNMTWGYTEGFTGNDSMMYRISLDTELGNNDSFINAWELLNIDKVMRNLLRDSINSEFDVRIDNESTGIEMLDVDSYLSPAIIGNTRTSDTVMNRYNITYRWKDSLLNAGSIWFLGQAKSPVTIILPAGIDLSNISGMDNIMVNIGDRTEISGFFSEMPGNVSRDRGEIMINFTKIMKEETPGVNITNFTIVETNENVTETVSGISPMIKNLVILLAGVVLIFLIYVFGLRK